MHRKIYLLFGMVFLFGMTNYVTKAESGALSLNQAISLALEHDFQVQNDRNQKTKSGLGVKEAAKGRYPQATVDYSLQHDLINEENSNRYSLMITETFETGWSLYGSKVATTVKAASWEEVLAGLQFKITQANTIYNTTSLYLQVLKLTENLRLNQLASKNLEKAASIAAERLKLGKITKSDELKIQNDLANSQYELEKCQADRTLALTELANQIGMLDPNQLYLENASKSLETKSFNYVELRNELLKRRLEINQSEIGLQKARRIWAQQKNEILPNVGLGYNYQQLNGSQNQTANLNYSLLNGTLTGNAQTQPAEDLRSVHSSQNLALNLDWKFNYGSSSDRAKQAQLDVDNALNSQKQTIAQVKLDLEKAISTYELATKKISISQKAIAYYQKNLSVKQLELKLGTVTQLEVALVEQELLVAQLNVVSSQYDQLIADQKLKLAAGLLYPEK